MRNEFDDHTADENVRIKLARRKASLAAEQALRRERIKEAGHDPDAYPRKQSECHHPYFDPTARCYACGWVDESQIKRQPQ